MTGLPKKKQGSILKDENCNIIIDLKQKLIRWKEYIQQLFYDNTLQENHVPEEESGPKITKEEVIKATYPQNC